MATKRPTAIRASCRTIQQSQQCPATQFRGFSQTCKASQRTPATERGPFCDRIWRPQLSKRQWLHQSRYMASAKAGSTSTMRPEVPDTHLPVMQGMVDELAEDILQKPSKTKKLPEEKAVLGVLKQYHTFVKQLLNEKVVAPKVETNTSEGTATSALLKSVNKKQAAQKISKEDILKNVSNKADQIIEAESIFITSDILSAYIALQSSLGRPHRFPHVFRLYREKPAPRSIPTAPFIAFSKQNPDSPSVSIPLATADAALNGAIESRDLALALAVVDESFCTKAYMRSKFLRSALFPLAGAVLTPLAAYSLASRFAMVTNTMDNSYATGVAMAGILTYTSTVGTIGYVALTTANDEMKRITWAQGMPLWERWVRKEERGAVDLIAQAWGFKSMDRWGDEAGKEWDELREWTGIRGMVLDKVELMEGME